MDTKGKLTVLSRNRGVFMDTEVENKKKETPRKDVSVKHAIRVQTAII